MNSVRDVLAELHVGQTTVRSRRVSDDDIRHFADATGDYNPIHLDEDAGRRSMFGSRIAHGMLSAGFISAAIANDLPGAGSVYLSQSLRFLRPVRPQDEVTVHLEVTAIDEAKRRVTIRTVCRNQHGQVVIDGEAVVLVPAPSKAADG